MPSRDDILTARKLQPISSAPVLVEEPENVASSTDALDRTSSTSRGSLTSSLRHHRTSGSKRLSGRPAPASGSAASVHSVSSISSIGSSSEDARKHGTSNELLPGDDVRRPNHAHHVISQVAEWLHQEKARRAARRLKSHRRHGKKRQVVEAIKSLPKSAHHKQELDQDPTSSDSDSSLALHALDKIISSSMQDANDGSLTPTDHTKRSRLSLRKPYRKSSKLMRRKHSTAGMSDSDAKADMDVPSAEVVLDNSKTLAFAGGRTTPAWVHFKHEIVRLTHTLKIKGWKRMPLDQSKDMDVSRLSGALTNAVYVVSPPPKYKSASMNKSRSTASLSSTTGKPPPKLLLRIYGPQVEHLIDRENELQILRRLAQKSIGPTLLGTFINGRFEEFLHARTLETKDLRVPQTSEQIAKRMRELHDGIELLKQERDGGASVWMYWDKWKERCEEVITWLDEQILDSAGSSSKSKEAAWMEKGLICGIEWSVFRGAVRKYRDWLYEQYGGEEKIKERLIFAHNDTQYGNLMRLEPPGESPLQLPQNSHKQLQVIDFEYAAPNVPGLEFANHFTEWCYNYHDEAKPYGLNEKGYPTIEEQYRFLKAYVQHTPPIQAHDASTSRHVPTRAPSSSISTFVLDSRAPPSSYAEEESKRDQRMEEKVRRLQQETRLWRLANSAQWVAWGIVQAKVPGMAAALEAQRNATPTPETSQNAISSEGNVCSQADEMNQSMDGLTLNDKNDVAAEGEASKGEAAPEEDASEEEEFDYLGYAQERALFFWGDVLQLGIMGRDELPENLLRKIKVVEH